MVAVAVGDDQERAVLGEVFGAFEQVARLSGGAYCPFDSGSAQQLRDLLSAVAVYAAGGRQALIDFEGRRGEGRLRLTQQLDRKK